MYADNGGRFLIEEVINFFRAHPAKIGLPGRQTMSVEWLLSMAAVDPQIRWQFPALFDYAASEFGQPIADTPRVRNEGFDKPFGIRATIGQTTCPWLEPRRYAIPTSPDTATIMGALCHRTRLRLVKSILQRGLRGGGFGNTAAKDLQTSAFLPWDAERNKAGGRESFEFDAVVVMKKYAVLRNYPIYVV